MKAPHQHSARGRRRSLLGSVAVCALLAAATLTTSGCSTSTSKANSGDIQVAAERRKTELVHEDCDLSSDGAQRRDANLDGRPEIVKVMAGARVACEAVDLNMDGVIDLFSYYDGAGKLRRREYGLDRDNRPNEIVIYRNGVLSQKLRETNNDRKIDTWDYYENGRLVREERDSTGDGFVDQWWTFNRPKRPNCAVVVSDEDGDGRPDAESQLDTCPPDAYGALPPPTPVEKKPPGPASDAPSKPEVETGKPVTGAAAAPAATAAKTNPPQPAAAPSSPAEGKTP
jgi:hypothetical protein